MGLQKESEICMNVTSMQLLALVEEQSYRCALTGRKLTPPIAALDHKVPVSRGGALKDKDNLQVLHTDVNRAKGTMTTEEFVAMCKEVAEYCNAKAELQAKSA